MSILTEIEEEHLEKDITQVTLDGMTVAVVDLHQVQVQNLDPDLGLMLVQLEIEIGVTLTILPMTAQIQKKVKWTNYNN